MSKQQDQCSFIFRSDVLHPSFKVGGTVNLGRCDEKCFPGLVVCYEHADKGSIALVARQAMRRLEDTKKQLAILKLAKMPKRRSR